MIQQLSLKLLPQEAASDTAITQQAAAALGIPARNITGYNILKRSIDARSRQQVYYILTLLVFVDEPFHAREVFIPSYEALVPNAPRVVIIGAGPAGLFAALHLIARVLNPLCWNAGRMCAPAAAIWLH